MARVLLLYALPVAWLMVCCLISADLSRRGHVIGVLTFVAWPIGLTAWLVLRRRDRPDSGPGRPELTHAP
jgi:hypothetical protein